MLGLSPNKTDTPLLLPKLIQQFLSPFPRDLMKCPGYTSRSADRRHGAGMLQARILPAAERNKPI